ncbi:MAG: GTP-binding protein [Planctomycetaceae bacterium]|nr:GTP-binding protein [Planctomycetales bacterium]MCB9921484.1 GTP-binding protein [Planctomycetaceae bacterium]
MTNRIHNELAAKCVATRLTSEGRGAVTVIAVEGFKATEFVGRHFASAAGKPLASFPLRRIIFGRWKRKHSEGEEIVVCRTDESSLEIHCHGGVAAARAIMESLAADGVVEQGAETWANHHSSDLIQAEAWLALADARTERTAAILLDQYRGALRKALEATIEDLVAGRTGAARDELATLYKRCDIGLHLTKPWRIAFGGPPNVGKSSLMNRLLGYQRSIVFDQPGTTRDLLSAPTALNGWFMELTDTAGLRNSEDAIEIEGVSRATSFLAEADLVVLVIDTSQDWSEQQRQLASAYPEALLVVNKCDLRDPVQVGGPFLATSALTNEGVAELMQAIVQRLVGIELSAGDAVPFTFRQREAIEAASRAVDQGEAMLAIEELRRIVASEPTASYRTKPS